MCTSHVSSQKIDVRDATHPHTHLFHSFPGLSPIPPQMQLINIAAFWQFDIEWAASVLQTRRKGPGQPASYLSTPLLSLVSQTMGPSPVLRLV